MEDPFTNSTDLDGADDILGTADDGLVPEDCDSLLFNAGNNTQNSESTDIAGEARVFDTIIDIGAYEKQTGLDIENPTAVCQDITVQLDANGEVSITTALIDNGSSDNCTADADLTFALDITDFDCTDMGDNTVTLTVTDEAGNESSCEARVTVEDSVDPTACLSRHHGTTGCQWRSKYYHYYDKQRIF